MPFEGSGEAEAGVNEIEITGASGASGADKIGERGAVEADEGGVSLAADDGTEDGSTRETEEWGANDADETELLACVSGAVKVDISAVEEKSVDVTVVEVVVVAGAATADGEEADGRSR